ncbi:DUF1801 domain-containing protein [Sphingomonas sp. BGYR3]|uniref:DUF1801 domain-containing protein n=1 Tax=Sphingomonas sp. BGYR3 TaxID=2975483 RepID=UPI0021A8A1E9|nr:DUF1801 domain-containing protein [Sphingomonas sp. BGYR3]MDG5488960.1 DUF1801 domain-containing protein [Sphingomonas sp. BGYR3]
MTENKTLPTDAAVAAFLDAVPDAARRADAVAVTELMAQATGQPAVLWGPSIIGFGRYRYRYASGREGEMCRVGFSPRKAELVFYVGAGRPEQAGALTRLGKHKTGKGCLYIKKLADVDTGALGEIVRTAYAAPGEGEVAD